MTDLSDLRPRIVIGKRYLLTLRPVEAPCSGCGRAWGQTYHGETEVVIIDGEKPIFARCPVCGTISKRGEGWYTYMRRGRYRCAPYTMLSELPDEDYKP